MIKEEKIKFAKAQELANNHLKFVQNEVEDAHARLLGKHSDCVDHPHTERVYKHREGQAVSISGDRYNIVGCPDCIDNMRKLSGEEIEQIEAHGYKPVSDMAREIEPYYGVMIKTPYVTVKGGILDMINWHFIPT